MARQHALNLKRHAPGLTLLEVLIAVAVVTVALLALISSVLACLEQTDDDREDMVALSIARDRLETLQTYCDDNFCPNVFVKFGPSNGGASSTDGGYSMQVSTLPNCTCNILFPVDANNHLVDAPLPSTLVPSPTTQFGTPIDLTGVQPIGNNSGIDASDHSSSYKVLPVIIRVQWDSATRYKTRSLEIHAVLSAIYKQ